ncbi:ion channel protein Tsx [Ferrimonas sediminicola]|uniref:Ion channel protein Tsx n=1 Tax=Ferrimonas sediminicola TaxID=2569538 RepID=A0A4U1BJT0_9GAMM|nr:outer membrane protein OmpK [Ferrimonas sediminicola]TKB51462.1 ion channel protein Tsx [Ferrimonas sediminicola]
MKRLILTLAALSLQAQAGSLVHWHDVSVTGLYGDNFKLAPSDQQATLTLESAGGWRYGDWFLFQDFTHFRNSRGSDSTTYGELTTRLSSAKIFGTDYGKGALKDLSLAMSLEQGKGDVESLLCGVGVDLKLPGADYFKVNAYRRQGLASDNISDGWQLSPSFKSSLPLGKSQLVLDGYIDWVISYDDARKEETFHFNPQLKYDLGALLMDRHNTLMVGIEYSLWLNKYGIKGVDQDNVALIVKYHL